MVKYIRAIFITIRISFYIFTEALEQTDMHHLVGLKDALTGLFNRKYYQYYTSKNKRRIQGYIMLDVDHFKLINDTRGHDAGDLILIKVADFLKTIPAECKVFRYAGDEFVICVTDRKLIPEIVRYIKYNVYSATGINCSIGAGYDWKTSDIALYQSKILRGRYTIIEYTLINFDTHFPFIISYHKDSGSQICFIKKIRHDSYYTLIFFMNKCYYDSRLCFMSFIRF